MKNNVLSSVPSLQWTVELYRGLGEDLTNILFLKIIFVKTGMKVVIKEQSLMCKQ